MLCRLLSIFIAYTLSTTAVFADVKFTKPAAGSTETGGNGLTVEWEDSGDQPRLTNLISYQMFLCAGGNDENSYVSVKTLGLSHCVTRFVQLAPNTGET